MLYEPDESLLGFLAEFTYEREEDCQHALWQIQSKIEDIGSPGDGQDPFEVLGTVESWAGLLSYPVIRTYAPESPMRFATWSQQVPATLWRAAQPLRTPLAWVAQTIGAADFTIGVNFPWGVSVSLTWT